VNARARAILVAWAPLALVCAVALGCALLARAPESALDSDDALDHRLFNAVASDETNMRHEAAKAFPTDLWSRDDDFHRHEGRKVREWSGAHHMRLSDAFRALDEGLRSRWPNANSGPLILTTPPCRPRAIY
jgi:hypothetical protein